MVTSKETKGCPMVSMDDLCEATGGAVINIFLI